MYVHVYTQKLCIWVSKIKCWHIFAVDLWGKNVSLDVLDIFLYMYFMNIYTDQHNTAYKTWAGILAVCHQNEREMLTGT